MAVYKFELFADYFQFYLADECSEDDTSAIWTDEAIEAKLGVAESTLAVGTFRNVDVNVEIEILGQEPTIDFDEWDHATRGYLSIFSGKCAVYGCTDYLPDATHIELPNGLYSAVSLAKGLDSIVTEWDEADDYYKVILWPSKIKDFKVLKKYQTT